ncbi:substrate-binding periplasmic protein [Spirochaeta lutea]|uniref:substrate-binding periplasmic protein n=1 Tax=Spirochaeta lutea TaxID=1480694 RepID=UPI000691C03F|nr:transporter substrate-binding domain-containing protein [Spirochaeta lutea]
MAYSTRRQRRAPGGWYSRRGSGLAALAALVWVCLPLAGLAESPRQSRLEAEEPVIISTSYQNFLSNCQGTGMLDEIILEAFRRVGGRAKVVYNPTEQALYDVNAGIFQGELNRVAGMEKDFPNLVRVPEANMVMDFVAFSRQALQIRSWEDLRELSIGIVRGWKILEEQTADFPWVILVPTQVELFTMLDKGRIDVALYDYATGYTVLADLGYQGIRHLEPPLATRPMYLYLHRDYRELVQPLADALRAMKADGTYQEMVSRGYSQAGIPPRN